MVCKLFCSDTPVMKKSHTHKTFSNLLMENELLSYRRLQQEGSSCLEFDDSIELKKMYRSPNWYNRGVSPKLSVQPGAEREKTVVRGEPFCGLMRSLPDVGTDSVRISTSANPELPNSS